MPERLDIARSLSYHTEFLRQVAKSNSEIDIQWNLEEVRRSLSFIAEHGEEAGGKVVSAAARIFMRTQDDETRRACLESLSRINNPKAKNELLRISQNKDVDQTWKDIAESYAQRTGQRNQPIAAADVGPPRKAGQPQ